MVQVLKVLTKTIGVLVIGVFFLLSGLGLHRMRSACLGSID